MASVSRSSMDETVWLPSRRDDDLSSAGFQCLIADGEGDVTLLNDEDLGIGMLMQPRTGAGRGIGPEERHRDVSVVLPLELRGDSATGEGIMEIASFDELSHLLLRSYLNQRSVHPDVGPVASSKCQRTMQKP